MREIQHLTPTEAAEELRVAPQTLWRYGAEGRVEVVRLTPRTLRYTAASVDALIAGGRVGTDQAVSTARNGEQRPVTSSTEVTS